MTNQFKEVPDGFVLLQRTNGKASHAACMTGRFAGWLMCKHPDGQWVSDRKLEPWELMQVEDQRDDGIVHEVNREAAPAPLTDDLQDQLTGAMYALRHIAAGGNDPAKCAQSALDVIERLHSHAEAIEQRVELDDSDFYPPRALLKREDWNPATRKPHVKQIAEAEAAPAPQQSESIITPKLLERLIDEHTDPDFGLIVEPFARAIEREVLAKAAPAAPAQTAETTFAGWHVRKESDGAIVVQKPKRGGCVLGGPHEDTENIEHTIFYAFLNDLLAAPVQAEQAQAEPVGEVIYFAGDSDLKEVAWKNGKLPPVGTKLYAAPVAALPAQAEQAAAVRAAALEEAANEAEHWQQINTSHKCGEYIAAAIRALAAPSTATSNDTGAIGDTGGEK